jgi:hypothetical protein
MPWILLALAFLALVGAVYTTSAGVLGLLLLASFVLCTLGIMGLVSRRMASTARSEASMLGPAELAAIRAKIEADKAAAAARDAGAAGQGR